MSVEPPRDSPAPLVVAACSSRSSYRQSARTDVPRITVRRLGTRLLSGGLALRSVHGSARGR